MYLLGKRADHVDSQDIFRLLKNKVQESVRLDYKREFKLEGDGSRKEFLYDVAAMYNTEGGCIIYGISEEKDDNGKNTGVPDEIHAIGDVNSDQLTQKIEDLVNTSTEPAINVTVNVVKVEDNNVLVLGIPGTFGLPSMVTYKRSNKFYRRRKSGKYLVDVFELNRMFMQNQILLEKISQYRRTRIDRVISCTVFPNLNTDPSVIVHIIPQSFSELQITNFSNVSENRRSEMFPIFSGAYDHIYNVDGFATFTYGFDRSKVESFTQIVRTGTYETYSSDLTFENQFKQIVVPSDILIKGVLQSINNAYKILDELNIPGPYYFGFSILKIKDTVLSSGRTTRLKNYPLENFISPLVLLNNPLEVKKTIKPCFDILYQAFGYKEANPSFFE